MHFNPVSPIRSTTNCATVYRGQNIKYFYYQKTLIIHNIFQFIPLLNFSIDRNAMSPSYFSAPSQPNENEQPVPWDLYQSVNFAVKQATGCDVHFSPSGLPKATNSVLPTEIRTNRKRSSTEEENRDDVETYRICDATPAKRRRGLADATAATVNSPFASSWGKY